MTHLLLFALIFGSLYIPAHQKKAVVNAPDMPTDSTNEYEEYIDDEEGPPGNLAALTTTSSVLLPYFEQETAVVYVRPNASSVKLRCPVKNFDATHHAILWYKNDNPITNGNVAFKSIYSLDNKFTLTISMTPVADIGLYNFSCHVMPQNLKHQVSIEFGDPPTTVKPSANPGNALFSSWFLAMNCVFFCLHYVSI